MKNFIAELLVKLAEKEDEANALRIQVDALEIVVTTLLQHMKQEAAPALDTQQFVRDPGAPQQAGLFDIS